VSNAGAVTPRVMARAASALIERIEISTRAPAAPNPINPAAPPALKPADVGAAHRWRRSTDIQGLHANGASSPAAMPAKP